MFGILTRMMHTATRADHLSADDFYHERRMQDRREEQARREREALDELVRYRRGYW